MDGALSEVAMQRLSACILDFKPTHQSASFIAILCQKCYMLLKVRYFFEKILILASGQGGNNMALFKGAGVALVTPLRENLEQISRGKL